MIPFRSVFWATTAVGYFDGREKQAIPRDLHENSMAAWRLWVSMSPVRNGSMKCDQLVMKIRVTGDLFYLSVQKHVCGFWFDPKVWKLCQLMFIFNLEKCMKW